jgi:hypothetical protein
LGGLIAGLIKCCYYDGEHSFPFPELPGQVRWVLSQPFQFEKQNADYQQPIADDCLLKKHPK